MDAQPGGKLYLIGFGPGSHDHLTQRAKAAIDESEFVIGYTTYINIIKGLLRGQEVVKTGMREEISRAQEAVRQVYLGRKVAVVSSGDAGIYGMAGLVFEVLFEHGWRPGQPPEVEVIPGVPALNACAALLGAPLMHDFASISLSDLLTPWEVIRRRIAAAAAADFVIVLYNPKSGRRTQQIVETQRIVSQHRGPVTPVGIVKSAYREEQNVVLTDLEHMLEHEIGMLTTVLIGNSQTFLRDGLIVTPRGYQNKYRIEDGGIVGQVAGLMG